MPLVFFSLTTYKNLGGFFANNFYFLYHFFTPMSKNGEYWCTYEFLYTYICIWISFSIIDYCYFAWPFYNGFKIFLKSHIWWNSRMQLQKDFGPIVHFIKKCLTLIHSLRWYIRSRANVEISASKSKNYHLPFF